MSLETVTIPLPVHYSRHTPGIQDAPGDRIPWYIGDPAYLTRKDGSIDKVIIDSKIVGHLDAPGEACYECIFPDERGARFCVSAKRLRIGEGWKP